jgi:hemoglobin-like flavoprotein
MFDFAQPASGASGSSKNFPLKSQAKMHRTILLLLIGAVAWTSAKECCSAGDRHVVETQWKALFEDQGAKFRYGVSKLLLVKVIEAYPEAKALFKGVNVDNPDSGEFNAHCLRIFNALDMTINLLEDDDALDAALDHLATQHQGRPGIKKAYFTTFGTVLFRGLPRILDEYDDMAWKACITGVLDKVASKLSE